MNAQTDGNPHDTHQTDTGVGQTRDAAAILDTDTSVLGQDDGDDTGGHARPDEQDHLPGYGDEGMAGGGNQEADDREGDPTDLDPDGSLRRRRPAEQILETGMGHFGGAGASGGTGPDLGRTGPDL